MGDYYQAGDPVPHCEHTCPVCFETRTNGWSPMDDEAPRYHTCCTMPEGHTGLHTNGTAYWSS